MRGTHQNTFYGLPATQAMVEIPCLSMITMRDGKMLSDHCYFDNAMILRQMGLMPPLERHPVAARPGISVGGGQGQAERRRSSALAARGLVCAVSAVQGAHVSEATATQTLSETELANLRAVTMSCRTGIGRTSRACWRTTTRASPG